MQLTRLIYASTISDELSVEEIKSIVKAARQGNPASGLTGLLYFNRRYFLQCLEGARTEVNDTFHRIQKDKRHKNIVILEYNEITERIFPDWSMGYLPESNTTQTVYMRFANNPIFNPYLMRGKSALGLVKALKETLSTK
ncbi:BLUF domain-containing protein [Marinomonas sp. 15G1-11]|uniref:BLUF domain-containing protein n=1 Tax=Marinomonas phaeophyticola TaxID=3004091 RepID=A0ABT4JSN3_9GAMM|nr:BLUF domain-containing protein [Marinomonas sp. 15G1-11]MCZ2720614.1 BLUF domain-containing protein [Marinomonas sp. 15G1-11]